MIERHIDTSRPRTGKGALHVSYCRHVLPYFHNKELRFWLLLFPSTMNEELQGLAASGTERRRRVSWSSSWLEHTLLYQELLT